MKNQRHEKIKQLILANSIETQDELIGMLRKEGFDTTQATVSRDIRELKISKVLGTNGKYHYVFPEENPSSFKNPYIGSIVDIDCAGNLVVVKTNPGLANAVAAGIDSVYAGEILGCVAGDDTIIAVARDVDVAQQFCNRLRAMIAER